MSDLYIPPTELLELDPCCLNQLLGCEPDEPALISCDVCAQGGVASGAALAGSSAQNACCVGGIWQFDGSATLNISGGGVYDTIIVFGHTADSISTPFGTQPGLCESDCGDFYAPVVFHGPLTAGDVNITLIGTGPQCVERIVVGRKLFFPEGLGLDFNDIFDGHDCKMDVKRSACGTPISATITRDPVSLDLSIQCVDQGWLKEFWRPAMRYMCRYGVCFMPSVNHCPDDVFCGWFESSGGSSSYSGSWSKTVSLQATGYTGVAPVK